MPVTNVTAQSLANNLYDCDKQRTYLRVALGSHTLAILIVSFTQRTVRLPHCQIMAQELPPWLDATFLAAALQGEESPESRVTVTKFSADLAVGVGDNYASRLYRAKVDYNVNGEERSTSLIVKAPFTKGIATEMGGFYDKEPNVYNHLLPKLYSLTNYQFGPKSLRCSEHNVLVLTDLKEQGYVMRDKYKQLDFPHCEQVIKALAKFHAASVACIKERPDLIDIVGQETLFVENEKLEDSKKRWLRGAVKGVGKTTDEMGLCRTIVDLFSSRTDAVANSVYRLSKPKENGLNVLNHGDLWVNNVLFKYTNTGHIVDVKFIDFQITRYATPVLDIIYFIFTSVNEEVRESRLPELCEIYRVTLNSALERLGCEEKLTEDKLREDFRDAIDWAILVICVSLAMIVSDKDDVINAEEWDFDDEAKFNKLFKSKHFQALLPKLSEHLVKWVDSLH